jgi:hypothetical protein
MAKRPVKTKEKRRGVKKLWTNCLKIRRSSEG